MSSRRTNRLFWLLLPLPFLAAAYVASRAGGGSWSPWTPAMADLGSMIRAAERMLNGEPIYTGEISPPFSMPPAAALFAVPLAVLGSMAAQTMWLLLTVALVCHRLVAPVVARIGVPVVAGGAARSPWVPVLAALAITMAAPIRDNFTLGQPTVLVLCLLLADIAVPHTALRLPRGLLTGVAAAVAVHPVAIIVLYLLVRRHRRAGLVAMVTAGSITLVAWAVAPGASARYLSSAVVGGHLAEDDVLDRTTNGSVQAVVHRALDGGGAGLGVVLSLILLAVAVYCGVLLVREGRHTLAVLTVAVAAVAAMPIAFPHAWVPSLLLAAYVLSGRFPPSWQASATVLGLWAAVMPPNRVGGSDLVAAGSVVLLLVWLGVVLVTSRARVREPR